MKHGLTIVGTFDLAPITTLLCDADDNLFPSERPAFAASTDVTNRFLARFGVTAPLSAEELRKRAVGKNFRTTALDLAVQCEVPLDQTLAQGRPAAVVASDSDVAAGTSVMRRRTRAMGARRTQTCHRPSGRHSDTGSAGACTVARPRLAVRAGSGQFQRHQAPGCLLHRHRPRYAHTAGRALQRGGFSSGADEQTRPRGVSACRSGTGCRRQSKGWPSKTPWPA